MKLVRIDIQRWGSPVAEQFKINQLPTVWLYEGTKRVGSGRQAVFGALKQR